MRLLSPLFLMGCLSQSGMEPASNLQRYGSELAVMDVEEDTKEESGELPPMASKGTAEQSALLMRTGTALMEADGVPEPIKAAPEPEPAATEQALRQWFPEAFVWQPLVETDASGTASVELRVPDQLTTWRVLALAHDRGGHQAGAVHTFDSTLPAYVDPVVPGWMHAGDRLMMPVQIINNQPEPLNTALSVMGRDAAAGVLQTPVTVGPFGSTVRTLPLGSDGVGPASLSASLSGIDAVRKDWTIHPTGRPVRAQRGGTLTQSKTLDLDWPVAATVSTVSVRVHPGPLAVVSAELERVSSRQAGAYGYGLVHHAQSLAVATGATLDPGALRTQRIRSWQQIVREARAPFAPHAADLLMALGGAEHGALLQTLRARLVRTVVDGQRGDGTWARSDRDTLQRVLVQTVIAARALPESESGARLRAEAAIERNLPQITDPYTAAVVLGSGLIRNDALRTVVIDGLVERDGQQTVAVPRDVRSAWGSRPTRTEMLAWTALALQSDDPELAGDLVSELMTTYSAERGFGGGASDAVALEAVVKALPAIDTPIALTMKLDGAVVSQGVVDPSQPLVPVVLEGVPASDSSRVELLAEPAGAGLAFVLHQTSWVPWTGSEGVSGVEVEVTQGPLKAGVEGELALTVSAPSGVGVQLVQGLPPGVSVDRERLQAVKGLVSVQVDSDRIALETRPLNAGEVLRIPIAVTPTYAGEMASRALEVRAEGREAMVAPHRWKVL